MERPDSAPVARLVVVVLTLALLGACASGERRSRAAPASRPPPSVTLSPSRSEISSVWRLRAGLNVAALMCRGPGRAAVTPGYRRLLSRHATLLAASYAAEQQRLGVSGFDRAQTRHYNHMAFQRSPVRFCSAAAGIAGRANAMDSQHLAAAAPGLANELEDAIH